MTVTERFTEQPSGASELGPILFVEDEPDDYDAALRQLSKRFVRNAAIRVHSLDAMMDFLGQCGEGCERTLPVLIIMDLSLRGETGFDGLAKIRGTAKYQKIPVILISTKDRLPVLKAAASVGADGYMVKPFDGNEFMNLAANLKLRLDFAAV